MALPQNKKKKSSEVSLKKIFMASNYFSNHLYFLKELKKVLLKKYEIQMVVRRNIETKLIAQCRAEAYVQKFGDFDKFVSIMT